MQDFRADAYRGQRVRLPAWVRSEKAGLANIWMRVDGMEQVLAFDNMDRRPTRGTSAWHRQEIVLDVPEDAAAIYFGLRLEQNGQAWADDFVFEVVDTHVKITSMFRGPGGKSALVNESIRRALPGKPMQAVNPDFEQ